MDNIVGKRSHTEKVGLIWLLPALAIAILFLFWRDWTARSGINPRAQPIPVTARGALSGLEETNIAIYDVRVAFAGSDYKLGPTAKRLVQPGSSGSARWHRFRIRLGPRWPHRNQLSCCRRSECSTGNASRIIRPTGQRRFGLTRIKISQCWRSMHRPANFTRFKSALRAISKLGRSFTLLATHSASVKL